MLSSTPPFHTFHIYLCRLFSPVYCVSSFLITNLLFNSWPCPIFLPVRYAVAFHSLLDVSLLPIFSFSLSHFHFFFFFGPFTLCSRWDFHWLKPDVPCTFVSNQAQLTKTNHLQSFSISLHSFHIHPWLSWLPALKWNEPQTDCV